MAGVRGRSPSAAVVERARGRVSWVDWARQGVVELTVFGEIVRVIA